MEAVDLKNIKSLNVLDALNKYIHKIVINVMNVVMEVVILLIIEIIIFAYNVIS